MTCLIAHIATLAISLALIAQAEPSPVLTERQASGCSRAKIVVSRASTEAPGEETIGGVSNLVMCPSLDLAFDGQLPRSASALVLAGEQGYTSGHLRPLSAQVNSHSSNYHVECPMGNSQGAPAHWCWLGNKGTLAGIFDLFPLKTKIKAVILMGDPSRLAGESFNKCTNTAISGLFPRKKGQLNPYADKIQSYFDLGDPF
ncbi:hypothetical protein BJ742DRAFT_736691 [Cladochytrium replicatum]|nr:hypothetical protein BJ742DRAFT_736691 [Cladochytrium replicatum]